MEETVKRYVNLPCNNVPPPKWTWLSNNAALLSPPAQRKRARTYASTNTVDGLNRRVAHLEDQLASVVSQLNHGEVQGVKLISPKEYKPLNIFGVGGSRKDSSEGVFEEGEEGSEVGDSDDDTLDQEADAAATLEL